MISFDNLNLQDHSITNESNIFDNESKNLATTNLCELLLNNIHCLSYQLTSEQINWINEFIKYSPSSFYKIKSDISSITSSGVIGLNNIPQIVKLIADIYYSEANNNNLVNSEHIISFIKYTLDVMFNSQLLILPGIEKDIIIELVDTSLILLRMNINKIESEIQKVKSSSCFVGFLRFLKMN